MFEHFGTNPMLWKWSKKVKTIGLVFVYTWWAFTSDLYLSVKYNYSEVFFMYIVKFWGPFINFYWFLSSVLLIKEFV